MTIVEFPDVKFKLPKGMASQNPFFIGSLGVPIVGECVPLAAALAAGIENTRRFVGGTIDEIVNGIRRTDNTEYQKISSGICLDDLTSEFAKNRMVYVVMLKYGGPQFEVDAILETPNEMYGAVRIADELPRAIFVPSENFTKRAWNFTYSKEALRRAIPYGGTPTMPKPLRQKTLAE